MSPRLHLVVRYQGQDFLVVDPDLTGDSVRSHVTAVLTARGCRVRPETWVIHFEDREIPLDQPFSQAIPDIGSRTIVVLEVEEVTSDFTLSLDLPDAPSTDKVEFELSLDDSEEVRLMSEEEPSITLFDEDVEITMPFQDEPAPEDGEFDAAEALNDAEPEEVAYEDEGSAEVVDDFEAAAMEKPVDFDDSDVGSEMLALEDEEDEDYEPVRKKHAASAAVNRQATVRYYNRMNPHRTYPLLVVLSKKDLLTIKQKHVAQASRTIKVREDSSIEIEPVLPGCACYPPRETVSVRGDTVQASFWVVPNVLGEVMQAQVVIRQGGNKIADIPLSMRVVSPTMVALMGAATFFLPFMSAMLRHFHLDFESQLDEGFSVYGRAVEWLIVAVRPEFLAVALLGLMGLVYLWLRPRKRDLFWDLSTEAPPASGLKRADTQEQRPIRSQAVLYGGIGGVFSLVFGGLVFGLAVAMGSFDRALPLAFWLLVALPSAGAIGGALFGVISAAFEGNRG